MKRILLPLLMSFVLISCSTNDQTSALSSSSEEEKTSVGSSSYVSSETKEEESSKEDSATSYRYINDKSELEGLTDDQLVELSLSVNKVPERYSHLMPYHFDFLVNSASSASEARSAAEERVTHAANSETPSIPTGSEVVLEGDLYYVVNVSWIYDGREYNGNSLSLKEQYIHFVAPQPAKGIKQSMNINSLVHSRLLLDIYELASIAKTNGFCLLCSELEDANDSYLYANYQIHTVYGDWGVPDEISLVKRTYRVAKQDGAVSFLKEEALQVAHRTGQLPA